MKKSKNIMVVKCQPGQILAEDVYWNHSLLIPGQTPLTQELINKLKNFGITSVPICCSETETDDNSSPPSPPSDNFVREYQENTGTIKDVLNDLASGRKLDLNKVSRVFDSAYNQIYNNYSLMDCINSVRNADDYTYTHSLNVALYSGLIARWMGLSEQELKDVIQAGLLHDIGKTRIPDQILNKKGPLTDAEFEVMKNHTAIGYQLAKEVPELKPEICNAVLMHHERMDGSGYPLGLTGKTIPLYAKIVAVADVYDALTSERIYKKRITPFDTFSEFQKLGYQHFDPQVLLVFFNNIVYYYIGAKVRMNTGDTGEVSFILPYNITKPIVKIEDKLLNLAEEQEYRIEEIL